VADRSHMALIDAALARAKAVQARPKPKARARRFPPKRSTPALALRHYDALEGVCEAYRVNLTELCSNDRTRSLAEARHVACWILRKGCRLSYPVLGELMGGRDHTTIMSSVRWVEARRVSDSRLRSFTDLLLADLTPGDLGKVCSLGNEVCSEGGANDRVW
jgi:hypothetical protein